MQLQILQGGKAKKSFGENNVDFEAAMPHDHSTAVKEYQEKQQRVWENNKLYGNAAGLVAGDVYRSGDILKVVH